MTEADFVRLPEFVRRRSEVADEQGCEIDRATLEVFSELATEIVEQPEHATSRNANNG